MTRPRKATDLDRHEQAVHDAATLWVACVSIGQSRTTSPHPSKEAAITAAKCLAAQTGRKVLIYAVAGDRQVVCGLVEAEVGFRSAILDR